MHQTKKSVHVLSDLSSCLSFGDNIYGKVAFFNLAHVHVHIYTMMHTHCIIQILSHGIQRKMFTG